MTTIIGCDKYADDYKKYLDNSEITYPGLARDVRYQAGYLRTVLVWKPGPDPNIDYYMVYWNNKRNEQRVDAEFSNTVDSIVVSIPDLEEYVYSFTIMAYDKDGNSSIGQELNNVRIYGTAYQSVLQNRTHQAVQPYEVEEDGRVKLYFNSADTLNTGTEIQYTAINEQEKTVILLPGDDEITIPDYKFGTDIRYRSSYVPEPFAADTIPVLSWDTFPAIQYSIPMDKSLFQPFYLPGDASDAWDWVLPYLWDGNEEEPGFHTVDAGFPLSFSLDMGTAEPLTSVKLWQRMSALYNEGNPRRFEVWGSNNPEDDGSWASWSLLGTFTNVKPSGLPVGEESAVDQSTAATGEAYAFDGTTGPVRYLRFRILEPWGNTDYFHLLELTVYKNAADVIK